MIGCEIATYIWDRGWKWSEFRIKKFSWCGGVVAVVEKYLQACAAHEEGILVAELKSDFLTLFVVWERSGVGRCFYRRGILLPSSSSSPPPSLLLAFPFQIWFSPRMLSLINIDSAAKRGSFCTDVLSTTPCIGAQPDIACVCIHRDRRFRRECVNSE